MNWTTEYPTKPGFYWIRNYQLRQEPSVWKGAHIVACHQSESGSHGPTFSFHGSDRDFEFTALISAEWYGPIEPPDHANREYWLNGWHRRGDSVLIGTGYHCAGCGNFLGLGCVGFDGTPLPEKMPDFPFEEATCPLCQLRRVPDPPDAVDKLTERLERLKKRGPIEPPE